MGQDTVIALNGEIYNYRELRQELRGLGHEFSSRSDTEVARSAYLEWGAEAIPRFNGMFAMAIWDHRAHRLLLARDRFGVKPLYYYCDDNVFVFASEIKVILLHPAIRAKVSLPVLDQYFTFQNILTDHSLFDGIRILPPGHTLSVSPDGVSQLRAYWDFPLHKPKLDISRSEASAEISRLLQQAVERQLVSDVPVGAYLSGGIDSGSVSALASQKMGRIPTFTCGFDMSSASGLEFGLDERAQAEELANLLKTEHYEVVLHAGDMEHVLPDLIYHLEDLRIGQCYPNFYVARLASKFVKVVLSGTGGDEIFAGYPWRYKTDSGPDFVSSYYKSWQRLVPDSDKQLLFRPGVYQASSNSREIFRSILGSKFSSPLNPEERLNSCLYFELKTFLHGLVIVEDKVSMAHGLETRLPFLDNDLVDFACSLPADFKIDSLTKKSTVDENDLTRFQRTPSRSREGKAILREALLSILPPNFVQRPKQGFSAPDASWFRGESIHYIRGLLLNKNARIYEYLETSYVRRQIEEHVSGEENHRLFIWSLLSFEWWLRRFLP